jgi:uncharacterized membrane protein YheB (UPF0754 family)
MGITVWPQGMIPRHRERLAQTIGNAVGNELMSQETIVNALFGTGFFRSKVEGFIDSYSNELLNTNFPSLLEALPTGARTPILDAISSLQRHLAEHITRILNSEETNQAIHQFVGRRVDEILAKRLTDVIDEKRFEGIIDFVEERLHNIVTEESFTNRVCQFIGERFDELMGSSTTLAEMFTPNTVAIIKERIDQQITPVVQHLTEIATSQKTRNRLETLIKHEVDEYYNQLNFIKKVFVSRDRLYREVDEMVNKTLPRRIEEFLRGEAFAKEADTYLESLIDDALSRPFKEIVGKIEQDKLNMIKDQVCSRILALAQSPELSASVSAYIRGALERVHPHTLRALLQYVSPDSAPRVKEILAKGLIKVLTREDTVRAINSILSNQVEQLLIKPIGRLSDHVPQHALQRANTDLADRILIAAEERLPTAIKEFDVGNIVRQRVASYPADKLESLVLSVAGQHLKTIEIFGAVIGLVIGIIQAIYFWYFSDKW